MAGMGKQAQTLPALPASAGALAEDGELGLELAGWLTAMSQCAAAGDERVSQSLIEACQIVPGCGRSSPPSPPNDPGPRLFAVPSRKRSSASAARRQGRIPRRWSDS